MQSSQFRWGLVIFVLILFGVNFLIIYQVSSSFEVTEQSEKLNLKFLEKINGELITLNEKIDKIVNNQENLSEEQKSEAVLRKEDLFKLDQKLESLKQALQKIEGVPKIPQITGKSPDEEFMLSSSKWLLEHIEQIQNPPSCEEARYLYCPIENQCGAGCSLHQLIYCMLVGLIDGRVTIFGISNWAYLDSCERHEWDCYFQSLTKCSLPEYGNVENFKENSPSKLMALGFFTRANLRENFFGYATTDGDHVQVPFWIHPKISKVKELHHDYRLWVVGHLATYVLRHNEQTKHIVTTRHKITSPFAGVHVRRTDHISEAPYRQLSEYVARVADWYEANHPTAQRSIYLATDEPLVVQEAVEKYPGYKWFWSSPPERNEGVSRTSGNATYVLLTDWYFLSHADFMVGTSSSQVTRMTFELMQALHAFTKGRYVSLDDPWYFP